METDRADALIATVREEMAKRIVGQRGLVDGLLIGLMAQGHVLVEGNPGLAKTLAIRSLSETLGISFKRIQFTPDMLPADLTGAVIYRQETGTFVARKGPLFTHVVLADEINRAPPKVHSALLEAMAEGQVTIGEKTHRLETPFFVMATQNPIEEEGTYELPMAQLDRFIMKLKVDYPTYEEEMEILGRMERENKTPLVTQLSAGAISFLRQTVEAVRIDNRIKRYIVSLVMISRAGAHEELSFSRYIENGASPRASIYLLRCSKAMALLEGRDYVIPEDIKAMAKSVLRHRIVPSYEAGEMTPDQIIEEILASISVP